MSDGTSDSGQQQPGLRRNRHDQEKEGKGRNDDRETCTTAQPRMLVSLRE